MADARGAHVARDHADAVAVVALEVGLDQVARNLGGLVRFTAERGDDVGDEDAQPVGVN